MITKLTNSLSQLTDSKQCHFLLAVSGGVDSMVLLQLFSALDLKFSVAHCNFNLRDKESDLDEELVEETAKKLGVQSFVKRFDTLKYKKENGVSIQMAARDLRYNWFKELKQQHKYDYLVTAHHLDDNIETVFLNLSRGTGIKGVSGMEMLSDSVFRPMLEISKEKIVKYAEKHQIEYREDVSNSSNNYKRNKLRNQILPLFQELNPSFVQTMATNISQISESTEFYNTAIEIELKTLIKRVSDTVFVVPIQKLIVKPSAKLLLFEILSPQGFNSAQVSDLYSIIENRDSVGKEFFSDSHRLLIDRKELIISEIKNTDERVFLINIQEKSVTYPKKISLKTLPITEIELNSNPSNAFLDANAIIFPLKLRKWKEGDRFRPLGMKGNKKVSDFLIDKKISRFEKEEVYVLETNGEICWLVGHRINDIYKITPSTKNVLKITLEQ